MPLITTKELDLLKPINHNCNLILVRIKIVNVLIGSKAISEIVGKEKSLSSANYS